MTSDFFIKLKIPASLYEVHTAFLFPSQKPNPVPIHFLLMSVQFIQKIGQPKFDILHIWFNASAFWKALTYLNFHIQISCKSYDTSFDQAIQMYDAVVL